MNVEITDILEIVSKQSRWRGKETINLIASENVQSKAVKNIEINDFMGRFFEAKNLSYSCTCCTPPPAG